MDETSSLLERDLPILLMFPMLHRLLAAVSPHDAEMLTRTQAFIVFALSGHGELTMSQIADMIGTSKEQATRAVAPLVDTGLAERFTLPANRKHVHIRLTQSGESRVHAFLRALTDRLNKRLSATEYERLRAAMLESVLLLKKCQ